LIEAAEGKIGSPINQLSYALGCFVYDESTGQYTTQVMGIMRIGGAVTALILLVALVPYWFFRRNGNPSDTAPVGPEEITTHPSTP
jgi:protein SCO1/2